MKAVIYARVSTASQTDGTSLQSQITACQEYARKNGLEVIEVVEEVYSGGYLHDRPALSKLRDQLRSFDAVITYAIDRLSRSISHLMILLDEFERFNVELHFVTETLDNTPEGKLLQSVKGYVAEIEREKIRERTMRGRRTAAVNGTLSYGRPLYGYTIESGRRQIDPDTAKWVRFMFQESINGESLRKIAAQLTEMNVPTPHGQSVWRAQSVKSIVNNPAYSGRTIAFRYKHHIHFSGGRRVHNGSGKGDPKHFVEIPNATPRLVSKKDWQAAQSAIQNRAKPRLTDKSKEYLLRGFIRCATCGRMFSPVGKKKHRYYVCTSTQNKITHCRTKSFPALKAEQEVWKWVVDIFLNRDYEPSSIVVVDSLPTLEKQITRVETEVARIVKRSAIADDKTWALFEKELLAKRAELESLELQKVKVLRERKKTQKVTSLAEIRKRIGENIHTLSFTEKVGLLKEIGLSCTWDGTNLHTTIHGYSG